MDITPTLTTGPLFTGEPAALAKLYGKMTQVMAQAQALEKTGRNDYFHYNYVEQDAVYNQVRQAMAAAGLGFLASVLAVESYTKTVAGERGDKIKQITRVTFLFTLLDSETGATLQAPWVAEGIDTEDKSINKASAQATKYFLMRTFLLGTGEPDPDGSEPTPGTRRQTQPQGQGQRQPAKPAQATQPAKPAQPDSRLAKVPQHLQPYAPSGPKDWTAIYKHGPSVFGVTRESLVKLSADSGNDAVTAYLTLVANWQPQGEQPAE